MPSKKTTKTGKSDAVSQSTQSQVKKAGIVRRIFGKKTTEKITRPAFLHVEGSPYLVAQVAHTERKRSRVRRAHTKTRKEVRGGGRKPWKQKGTGRARHASIRSPIWVGGGTVFGPRTRKERVPSAPQNMKRVALATALSWHAEQGSLEYVQFAKEISGKTKDLAAFMPKQRGILLLTSGKNRAQLWQAGRNLPGVRIVPIQQVQVHDVAEAIRVMVDEAGEHELEMRCRAEVKTSKKVS